MPGVIPARQAMCAVEHAPSEQLVGVTSSTTPLQSSSMPLHTSVSAAACVTLHVVVDPSAMQIRTPVRAHAPAPTVQGTPSAPGPVRNGSSTMPLQSSSMLLQISGEGVRTTTLPGHDALEPVQLSAGSQVCVEVVGRHTVLDGAKPSTGHALLAPVHDYVTSQTLIDARHTVPDGEYPSTGHSMLEPSQVSATSHTPTAARHTVPLADATSLGHAASRPVQVSCASHALADGRHTVPDGCSESPGHTVLEPVQVSARSHTSLAPRHTTDEGWKVSAGHAALEPVQVS